MQAQHRRAVAECQHTQLDRHLVDDRSCDDLGRRHGVAAKERLFSGAYIGLDSTHDVPIQRSIYSVAANPSQANPGKYSYASPGTGTTSQLAGELFRKGDLGSTQRQQMSAAHAL